MQDRLKKVVDGSNEGLMKDFFAQLAAGRERWLVPEKTFCELYLLRFLARLLSVGCYVHPFLDAIFSIAAFSPIPRPDSWHSGPKTHLRR